MKTKPRQLKKLNKEAKKLLLSAFYGEFIEDDFKLINGILMCYSCTYFNPENDYYEFDYIEARYVLGSKLITKDMTIKECRKIAKVGVTFR